MSSQDERDSHSGLQMKWGEPIRCECGLEFKRWEEAIAHINAFLGLPPEPVEP